MSIHSTVDGLAISAGSAALSSIGLVILFAVSYHKIPEGLALVSVARLAGYGRWKALGVTVLVELTTALGALIGLLFLNGVSELWLGIILGLVAGSFLYTVGFALLKEMYAHEKGSIFLYLALGFVSMLAISSVIVRMGIDTH
jgi:ZIP family zinc transporter